MRFQWLTFNASVELEIIWKVRNDAGRTTAGSVIDLNKLRADRSESTYLRSWKSMVNETRLTSIGKKS
jgi:hypothetical protein